MRTTGVMYANDRCNLCEWQEPWQMRMVTNGNPLLTTQRQWHWTEPNTSHNFNNHRTQMSQKHRLPMTLATLLRTFSLVTPRRSPDDPKRLEPPECSRTFQNYDVATDVIKKNPSGLEHSRPFNCWLTFLYCMMSSMTHDYACSLVILCSDT